jgi:hypothetical protein
MVQDTAVRPVADARIEVVEGARAGVSTTTDASGRYTLPGVFVGALALRASKDGYVTVTKPYETARQGQQALSFVMDLAVPSVNIGGEYSATFTADNSCTELPDSLRRRTYTATIESGPGYASKHHYRATLGGATFYPSPLNNTFFIGVAGDFAHVEIDFDGIGIAEELTPSTYVSIVGLGHTTIGGPQISVSLDGWFEYCTAAAATGRGFYSCADVPVTCRSTNHRLTLVRR